MTDPSSHGSKGQTRQNAEPPATSSFAFPYQWYHAYKAVVDAQALFRTPVWEKVPTGRIGSNKRPEYTLRQTGAWKPLDSGCLEIYNNLCRFADDNKDGKAVQFWLTVLAFSLRISPDTLKKRLKQLYYARLIDIEWGTFNVGSGRQTQTSFTILEPAIAIRQSLLVTGRLQPDDPTPITFQELQPYVELEMIDCGFRKSYQPQRNVGPEQLSFPDGLFNADGTFGPVEQVVTAAPEPARAPEPSPVELPEPVTNAKRKLGHLVTAAVVNPVSDFLAGYEEILSSWRIEGTDLDHGMLFFGSDRGTREKFRAYSHLVAVWTRERLPDVPTPFADISHVNEEHMVITEEMFEQIGKKFKALFPLKTTGKDTNGLVLALDHLLQDKPQAIERVRKSDFPLWQLCTQVKEYLHHPPNPETTARDEDIASQVAQSMLLTAANFHDIPEQAGDDAEPEAP